MCSDGTHYCQPGVLQACLLRKRHMSIHRYCIQECIWRQTMATSRSRTFWSGPLSPPVISPVWKIAVHMKSKLKEVLDNDVISPVDRLTDWLSHLVCTSKKNGELWLCLDPEHLNKALKREHYHLPVLREMLPDIAHAKVFSTFDFRNGYWHVKLDEESSYMTTFNTPFGRYRWLRLPFGTSVSSEMLSDVCTRPSRHW